MIFPKTDLWTFCVLDMPIFLPRLWTAFIGLVCWKFYLLVKLPTCSHLPILRPHINNFTMARKFIFTKSIFRFGGNVVYCVYCRVEKWDWELFNQISHHYITVMNDEIIVLGNFQFFGWMGANFVRYSRMNNFDWNCFFLDGNFSCRYGGIFELLDTECTTANIFIWFSFLLFQEDYFLKHFFDWRFDSTFCVICYY